MQSVKAVFPRFEVVVSLPNSPLVPERDRMRIRNLDPFVSKMAYLRKKCLLLLKCKQIEKELDWGENTNQWAQMYSLLS